MKTFILLCLLGFCTSAFAQQVTIVSAASFENQPVAAGSIVAAFGSGFGSRTSTLIEIIDSKGISIAFNNTFGVTSEQVNFLIPESVAEGAAQVRITNLSTGMTSSGTMTISKVSPGIFTANASGKNAPAAVALRVKADGSQVYESVSEYNATLQKFVTVPIAQAGDGEALYLILFGTGWKNGDAAASLGFVAGRGQRIEYLGAQGGFLGLDQLNLKITDKFPKGLAQVALLIDGKLANPVEIEFQ